MQSCICEDESATKKEKRQKGGVKEEVDIGKEEARRKKRENGEGVTERSEPGGEVREATGAAVSQIAGRVRDGHAGGIEIRERGAMGGLERL